MDWAEAAYGDLATARAKGRPYVAVNMVASADGAIAVDGRTAKLGGPSDHHLFHYLRSLADVILAGAQTVRAERYGPPRISSEHQAERVARGQAPLPRIAIVSRSLELDLDAALFTTPGVRPIVLAPESADPARLERVRQVADVIVAGSTSVDLIQALSQLDAGLLLCEGGPTINGELAAVDLVDELCLTVASSFVGGPVMGILGRSPLPDLLELQLVHAKVRDDDLFLRYRRIDREDGRTTASVVPGVEAFERTVGDLDYPMMIVTTAASGERSGCLVGFGTQVSISPGRFMVMLSKANHTYGVARHAEALAVHFPTSDDRALADLFGGTTGDEIDKFSRCGWTEGPHGMPVIDGLTRWFVGRIVDRIDAGDHVGFVLAPVAGEAGSWTSQLGFQEIRGLDAGHPAGEKR